MVLLLGSQGSHSGSTSSLKPTRTAQEKITPAATRMPETAVPTLPPYPPVPHFSSRDPNTYIDVVPDDPDTLDPALSYSTSNNPIPNNVYETLVTYRRDDPNALIPLLSTGWGISGDGLTYTFDLRKGVKFHNGHPLTARDVAYTFRRGVLQGSTYSPQFLFTEPLFGQAIYDITQLVDSSGKLENNPVDLANASPDLLMEVCKRVFDAITPVSDYTVSFHLAQPWAPFLATLAGSWGSIQSQDWVISNGGWDGDCADWQNYYGKNTEELNKTPLGSSAMGTGPYLLDHWTTGSEFVLTANPVYWRQEPAWQDGPTGVPAIQKVVVKIIGETAPRISIFQSGEADSIYAYTSEYSDVDKLLGQICTPDGKCQPTANPQLPGILQKVSSNNTHSDLFFTWNIDTQEGNPLIGSGQLDGKGIPADFFSDVHVRKAFAYCFNYEDFLNRVYNGEAFRTVNIMLPGMVGFDPNTPIYNYDPGKCADEFKTSGLKAPDGRSLWDVGFTFTIPYTTSSLARQAIAEIYQRELGAINPNFKILTQTLESADYLKYLRMKKLPLFTSGWIEDIHDSHNWLEPYTTGLYSTRQNMSQALINSFKDLLLQGVSEIDPARRSEIYRMVSQVYFEEAPGFLLFTGWVRHYQQRWVQGWYPNPAYPGTYYYVLRKN
jgi:peptide/nickel transport system substrate-binding protein